MLLNFEKFTTPCAFHTFLWCKRLWKFSAKLKMLFSSFFMYGFSTIKKQQQHSIYYRLVDDFYDFTNVKTNRQSRCRYVNMQTSHFIFTLHTILAQFTLSTYGDHRKIRHLLPRSRSHSPAAQIASTIGSKPNGNHPCLSTSS